MASAINITIAHWNGGSSFLAKSDRGREKLNEIENFLKEKKIDILGVSEANLDSTIPECEYKIPGYSIVRSHGAISRIITYISDNLIWRELKDFAKDVSCNWLEIGKGKSKLTICMYYREFKILGIDGSNSFTAQVERLESFLNISLKTRNLPNVILLGDFNVNLNGEE